MSAPTNNNSYKELGARHQGDLGGRLKHAEGLAHVSIEVERRHAALPCTQHLLWMLVNLLARQFDEIGRISLNIAPDIPQATVLSSLIPPTTTLVTGLRSGISEIDPSLLKELPTAGIDVHLIVGPELAMASEPEGLVLWTAFKGWAGYVGDKPPNDLEHNWSTSGTAIGAYVAACLTAGEVFKAVRQLHEDEGEIGRPTWLDAHELTVGPYPPVSTPELPPQLPYAALAGVGAVGTALLQTLYALQPIRARLDLLDNDPNGLEQSNLNRYPLFGLKHIGERKASLAATLASRPGLVLKPHDTGWQEWSPLNPQARKLVLSAVDTNQSRRDIQRTMPTKVLAASTSGMRLRVNAFDLGAEGPCVGCHDPVDGDIPDEIVTAKLKAKPEAERKAIAAAQGISFETLEQYLGNPQTYCGRLDPSALRAFARDSTEGEHAWSVGFVSTLAGVLLAAEYVKTGLGQLEAALHGSSNCFNFQFWRPLYRANRRYEFPADSKCACQTDAYRRAVATLTSVDAPT